MHQGPGAGARPDTRPLGTGHQPVRCLPPHAKAANGEGRQAIGTSREEEPAIPAYIGYETSWGATCSHPLHLLLRALAHKGRDIQIFGVERVGRKIRLARLLGRLLTPGDSSLSKLSHFATLGG